MLPRQFEITEQPAFEDVTLGLSRLDRRENPLNRVDGVEEQARQRRVEIPCAVAEFVEDVLGNMRDGFQALVTEESAGAFDGMNRSKNAGQEVAILWRSLQFHHFVVQAGQILRTFDEELLEDVKILHVRLR